MPDIPHIVVCTAGHIDHGKSRLVWALTGTNPDRLPEELERGMTIDLGFAHLELPGAVVSFVDVPGHERFIRTMVAGAAGVDLALLIVAADDGVMPQTREHVELLALLGVQRVILVVTKIDLVDAEWADQVALEARDLLRAHSIEPIETVHTSAESGAGLDRLRTVLAQTAAGLVSHRSAARWFRMPVDRAFAVAGRGTVVTGSVAHGNVSREDELELWPAGRRVRARDLQTHGAHREGARGRLRLAVNLAGIPLDEVRRGCELAQVGYLRATTGMDVWLSTLRCMGKPGRRSLRVRLHMATSDVLAELHLPEPLPADGGHDLFAHLALREPVVAEWNDAIVLRDESASHTLGGGRVVRPVARRWSARHPVELAVLQSLRNGAPDVRVEAAVHLAAWEPTTFASLAAATGLPDAETAAQLVARLRSRGRIRVFETPQIMILLHADHLKRIADELSARVSAHLRAHPRLPGIPLTQWPAWMPRACPERVRPLLAEHLASDALRVVEGHVVPGGREREMPAEDAALLAQILEEFRAAECQPPDAASLRCVQPRNAARVRELIHFAAARRQLERIADGIWLHADCWRAAQDRVRAALQQGGRLTVAQIRDLLGSSRKFAVPIAEHLDASGLTRRVGDLRVLKQPVAPQPGTAEKSAE